MDVNSDSLTTASDGVLRPRVSVGPTPGVWPIMVAERFWWSGQIKHSAPVLDFDDVPFVLLELIWVRVASSAIVDCAVLASDSTDLVLAP